MKKPPFLLMIWLLCAFLFNVRCNQESGSAAGSPAESSAQPDSDFPELSRSVKRVGMVIKIRADQIEAYKRLHGPENPGVRDLLSKYHMRNFSIFLHQLDDDNYYEFGYYEYTGDDFEVDMEKLAAEPRNIEWLKICDPMQVPLDGHSSWAEMEQVYFNP